MDDDREEETHRIIKNVIVSIDVGSSSIRCIAYDVSLSTTTTEYMTATEDNGSIDQLHDQQPSYATIASYHCPRKSIDPYTGQILIDMIDPSTNHTENDTTATTSNNINKNLFDTIDMCMDHVMQQLWDIEQQCKEQTTTATKINIVAIGFTTFVMNFIGVNQYGIPLGNYATMSYACQTNQVHDEVIELKNTLGPSGLQSLYQATGVPIHAAYALPQLRSWYRHNISATDNDNKVYQWQTIASICIRRWMLGTTATMTTPASSFPISYSEASWTGLLNFRSCQYETQVLNLLPNDCIDALPSLVDYDGYSNPDTNHSSTTKCASPNNTLTNKSPYWTRWSVLHTIHQNPIQIFFGVGDGACANIGSKCTTIHRIACTIGTSAAARICMYYPTVIDHSCRNHQQNENNKSQNDLVIPSGLFCYRINRYHVLMGGALTDGGNILEWMNHHLLSHSGDTTKPMPELQASIEKARELLRDDYSVYINSCDNGSTDNNCSNSNNRRASQLIMIPFFSGERSTGYRTNATGTIVGLTLETRPHHIVKACLESTTLRLSAIIHLIQGVIQESQNRSGVDINRNCENVDIDVNILCSGKALEINVLWRTMISDCTGLPVCMEDQTYEGTSRGVVILAYHAMFGRRLLRAQQETNNNKQFLFDMENITQHSDNGQIHPNLNVRGYWTSLFEKQEAIINALSNTLNWS